MKELIQDRKIIEAVRSCLKHGRRNAVKSDEISQEVGIHSRTNEKIRCIIRYLVEYEGDCIGSCSSGFYFIDDLADLNLTVNNLKARGRSIFDRARILENNFAMERVFDLEEIKR